MVRTSINRGTFDRRSGSAVSSAAAMSGRAAFLAPLTCTSPQSVLPPRMTSWSTATPWMKKKTACKTGQWYIDRFSIVGCPFYIPRRRATTTRGRPARSRQQPGRFESARGRQQGPHRLGLVRPDLQQKHAAGTDAGRDWTPRSRGAPASRRPPRPAPDAAPSWTSGISVASSGDRMYGGFATTRSTDPAGACPLTARHRSPRRNAIRSATPCRSALARATRSARQETSVASRRAVGSSFARAMATAPDPVHNSTMVGPASAGSRLAALGSRQLSAHPTRPARPRPASRSPAGEPGRPPRRPTAATRTPASPRT